MVDDGTDRTGVFSRGEGPDEPGASGASEPRAPAKVRQERSELLARGVVVREQSRITREVSEATRDQATALRQESHELARQVQTLTQALETRTEIAMAMGLLMARENMSGDEAFAVLRRASQRTNRKLRDIAVDMLAVHDRRVAEREEPRFSA